MLRRHLVSQRLTAVFLLGCLLFNYPLLALFNLSGPIFGLPANVVWLFGSWLLLIALIALIIERPGDHHDNRSGQ
jgi:hypothetical protein